MIIVPLRFEMVWLPVPLVSVHDSLIPSAVAVTVNLDRLPISRALRASSARPRTDALAGGEDYELLFAVRGQAAAGTLMGMAAGLAAPLTHIGWFDKAGTGSRVRDLRGRPLGHGGYRHF